MHVLQNMQIPGEGQKAVIFCPLKFNFVGSLDSECLSCKSDDLSLQKSRRGQSEPRVLLTLPDAVWLLGIQPVPVSLPEALESKA